MRQWIPTDWLDEVVTGLADKPSDFLTRREDGTLELRPTDPPDDPDVPDWRVKALTPGEVVKFSWTENYGVGTLIVGEDGRWTCDRDFPDTATHFWLPFDSSTMESSLNALVTGEGGWGDADPLEPGEYTVGAYTWSEGPGIPFTVRVLESGAAEFVEAGTA